MIPESINDPIAERLLTFEDAAGNRKEITVRLGRPRPAGEDWACAYQIAGFEVPCGLDVYGVDSMQALLLAMKGLSVELHVAAERSGGRLSWLDSSSGFPVSRGREGTVEW